MARTSQSFGDKPNEKFEVNQGDSRKFLKFACKMAQSDKILLKNWGNRSIFEHLETGFYVRACRLQCSFGPSG